MNEMYRKFKAQESTLSDFVGEIPGAELPYSDFPIRGSARHCRQLLRVLTQAGDGIPTRFSLLFQLA
jgi:hypothetical protein